METANRRSFLKASFTFLSLPLWAQGLLEQAEAQLSSNSGLSPFFSPQQSLVMARLIDLILPASKTPGALDAGVPEFIDRLLTASPVSTQAEFRMGLHAFSKWSQGSTGKAFLSLSEDQQLTLIHLLFQNPEIPTVSPWMKTLKLLVLFGYRNWSPFYNQQGLTNRYLGPEDAP